MCLQAFSLFLWVVTLIHDCTDGSASAADGDTPSVAIVVAIRAKIKIECRRSIVERARPISTLDIHFGFGRIKPESRSREENAVSLIAGNPAGNHEAYNAGAVVVGRPLPVEFFRIQEDLQFVVRRHTPSRPPNLAGRVIFVIVRRKIPVGNTIAIITDEYAVLIPDDVGIIVGNRILEHTIIIRRARRHEAVVGPVVDCLGSDGAPRVVVAYLVREFGAYVADRPLETVTHKNVLTHLQCGLIVIPCRKTYACLGAGEVV